MNRLLLVSLVFGIACSDAPAPVDADLSVGPSIYPLELSLRDQDAVSIGVDVFRGQPVIISMFYGSCPMACPLIISHVKQVQAKLPPEVREKTRVLMVSFDPENDTPQALQQIAADHHLDLELWKLATGSDDNVRPLAAALGISYRKSPGGGFAHDSVITILDREGQILARSDDPQGDLLELSAAVNSAFATSSVQAKVAAKNSPEAMPIQMK